MKSLLTKVCWPILRFFESDTPPENYQKSHRMALLFLSVVFIGLSLGSAWVAISIGSLGALVPVVFFFLLGFVALVIATLGSNAAVAKIWGTK